MEVFVKEGVDRIATLATGKKLAWLRDECKAYKDSHAYIWEEAAARSSHAAAGNDAAQLRRIPSNVGQAGEEAPAEGSSRMTEKDSESLAELLCKSCDSKNPKIMETALASFQKLISYGALQGRTLQANSEGLEEDSPPLVAKIIKVICACADLHVESVELQVIKVLLSAIASGTFQVHLDSLLLCVQTVFNITLASKSPINQSTARATLSQILNIVFQRMEADPASVSVAPSVVQAITDEASEADGLNDDDEVASNASGGATSGGRRGSDGAHAGGNEAAGAEAGGADVPAPAIGGGGSAAEHRRQAQNAAMSELSKLNADVDKQGLEAALRAAEMKENTTLSSAARLMKQLNPRQKDALLVFRALCMLSMKDHDAHDKEHVTAAIVLQRKLLAFNLMKMLLEKAGPTFRASAVFVMTMKQYLCLSLLRNCVSPVPQLFELASSILATLMLRFRDSLKPEIGFFFVIFVLRVLEDHGHLVSQQLMVVKELKKVCQDPQAIVDLFVNYDCDLEAANLVERMVTALARTAQMAGAAEGTAPAPMVASQNALKLTSLQCLLSTIQSLSSWLDRFKEPDREGGEAGGTENGPSGTDGHRWGEDGAAPATNGGSAPGVSPATVTDGADDGGEADSESGSVSSKAGLEPVGSNAAAEGSSMEDDAAVIAARCENAKAAKENMRKHLATGLLKFNLKPLQGVTYLLENKVLEKDPAAVAAFLMAQGKNIDKEALGEYLGGHDEFSLAVMHRYIDGLNFQGLRFHDAIRKFLRRFRLPGEAQKIDRLMEKFSEAYCRMNPTVFKSPDVAYAVSFSIIMLNTDAHNPMVKAQMSKADFVRMLNGVVDIAEGEYTALLEEIYDNIVAEELSLGEGTSKSKPVSSSASQSRLVSVLNLALPVSKQTRAAKQGMSNRIIRHTRALFRKYRSENHKDAVFYSARHAGHVRPVMEMVGWPALAAFSVAMEDPSESMERVDVCLAGMSAAIHVTAALGMDTMRNAFVASLARFTFLARPKDMCLKGVRAAEMLIAVAEAEGNVLSDSWATVLEYLSRLDRLDGSDGPYHAAMLAAGTSKDEVYLNTVHLNSVAIVDFVSALCRVALEELRARPTPVMYSLQKLVEISYYNMSRIRMVWSRIWAVVTESLFIEVGVGDDVSLAMAVIDSLRQLSIKYLEHGELANYTFQNNILKPFVTIIKRSPSDGIKELVVQCISQMVLARAATISSGWKSIFMVLTVAANDAEPRVFAQAFGTIKHVIEQDYQMLSGESFMDCVTCLAAFASNKLVPDAKISLEAISLLQRCSERLAAGITSGVVAHWSMCRRKCHAEGEDSQLPLVTSRGAAGPSALSEHDRGVSGERDPVPASERDRDRASAEDALSPTKRNGSRAGDDGLEFYWLPLFVGLSELTSDPRPLVRTKALETLFRILHANGATFTREFWGRVFVSILFSIFEFVRNATDSEIAELSVEEWLRDTCRVCLEHLATLFLAFYERVAFLLPQMCRLLLDLSTRANQSLATVCVGTLQRLVDTLGPKLDEASWTILLGCLRDGVQNTLPWELLTPTATPGGGPAVVQSRLRTHLSDSIGAKKPTGAAASNSESTAETPASSAPASATGAAAVVPGSAPPSRVNTGALSSASDGGSPPNSSAGVAGAGGSTGALDTRTPGGSVIRGPPVSTPFLVGSDQEIMERMLAVRCKCVVQLMLQETLGTIHSANFERLSLGHHVTIFDTLRESVDFAAAFNGDHDLRQRLRIGAQGAAPNLLRQEAEGSLVYLKALRQGLMCTLQGESWDKLRAECETRLLEVCRWTLHTAVESQGSQAREGSELWRFMAFRSPLVVEAITTYAQLPEDIFLRSLPVFYPLITGLVCSEQSEIRSSLSELLTSRITPILNIKPL